MDSFLIDQAKAVDLLTLIGRDVVLTRQAATHGGEWAGPCPFCGTGQDRLRVWPNHEAGCGKWWCRVCTQGGDAIQYVRLRDRASFRDAVQILAGAELSRARPETPAPDVGAEQHEPPSTEWQTAASACARRTIPRGSGDDHALDRGGRARPRLAEGAGPE